MSEIWDEFEKIAIAEGLVSVAEDEPTTKSPARYDSLSDDAIRFLYGLDPEGIFHGKDKIEVAHPDTVVIAPAYDAMNGVFENQNQRQAIMAYIATKTPNGNLTHRRYVAAKNDLINSLIRAAFTLDHSGDESLMSLADSCSVRLDKQSEKFIKEAIAPVAIAGVVLGGIALLGGAYYLMYGATTAQNVYTNSQMVLEALDSLNDKPYAAGIRTDVTNLMESARELYTLKDELANVKSVNDAAAMTQQDTSRIEMIKGKISAYVKQLQKIQMAIPEWVSKIELTHKASTNEAKSDWWAKVEQFIDPLYSNAYELLIDRLYGKGAIMGLGSRSGGLYEAIKQDIGVMSSAISAARQQAPELQELLMSETSEPVSAPKSESFII
jgi:hypothetical protein